MYRILTDAVLGLFPVLPQQSTWIYSMTCALCMKFVFDEGYLVANDVPVMNVVVL